MEYATTKTAGIASSLDVVIGVVFKDDIRTPPKQYSYFTGVQRTPVEVGDMFIVDVSGVLKRVTVQFVRQPQPDDRLKRVVTRAMRVHRSTKKEPEAMSIKITNRTLVNGQDISNYTDEQLFGLIRNAEGEIKTLNAIENKPQRLVRRIQELHDGVASLVKLLDERDKV